MIYIAHQIILEAIKIFQGKRLPTDLGVQEIDLSKSEDSYGAYKLKAVTNIKANINELLYIFNHVETRYTVVYTPNP